MTVKELIEKLKEYREDMEVLVRGDSNGTFGEANNVREGKHSITKDKVCITYRN